MSYYTLYVKDSKHPYAKSGLILVCVGPSEAEAKEKITFLLGENWPENYELRKTTIVPVTTLGPLYPEPNDE